MDLVLFHLVSDLTGGHTQKPCGPGLDPATLLKGDEDLFALDLFQAFRQRIRLGLDRNLRFFLDCREKKIGHPWTLAKCFDTSAAISDFVLRKDYQLKPDEKLELKVNGVIKQSDTLKSMIFNPAEIVEYISSIMTLEKGDLIFTGTPAGVSRVNRGDKLEAKLGDIAELFCKVV